MVGAKSPADEDAVLSCSDSFPGASYSFDQAAPMGGTKSWHGTRSAPRAQGRVRNDSTAILTETEES